MSEEVDGLMYGDSTDENAGGGHPQPENAAEALSWALLDEQITRDEIELLDTLLLSDDSARSTYLGCVQLHTDLLFHFQERHLPVATATAKSPVLGFLNDGAPPFGVQRPTAEDTRS
jgi:hypothetical protein